jgi:hypothetical protein
MLLPLLLIFIIVFTYTLACIGNHKSESSNGEEMQASVHTHVHTAGGCGGQENYSQPASSFAIQQKHLKEKTNVDHLLPKDTDYNEYMVASALEPSVVSSHQAYASDLANITHGASGQTVNSHDDSDVPKWGLRRVTEYVPVSANSRTVPSRTDESIQANSANVLKYGLF